MKMILMIAMLMLLIGTGCSSANRISDNLKFKTVNRSSGVYGMDLSYTLEDGSPHVKLGEVAGQHQTAPILPGQGVFINDVDYSFWTGNVIHTRTMVVLPLGDKTGEFFEKYPNYFKDLANVLKVDSDGEVKILSPENKKNE